MYRYKDFAGMIAVGRMVLWKNLHYRHGITASTMYTPSNSPPEHLERLHQYSTTRRVSGVMTLTKYCWDAGVNLDSIIISDLAC
mmetsp:Transcript_20171/g.29943  ORF Transcript_20171/g.29943 Transcript_20171/m.29943 type:complete len:84 (+) Transcript_20171:152-403(+)